jgi:hypothetical protein
MSFLGVHSPCNLSAFTVLVLHHIQLVLNPRPAVVYIQQLLVSGGRRKRKRSLEAARPLRSLFTTIQRRFKVIARKRNPRSIQASGCNSLVHYGPICYSVFGEKLRRLGRYSSLLRPARDTSDIAEHPPHPALRWTVHWVGNSDPSITSFTMQSLLPMTI